MDGRVEDLENIRSQLPVLCAEMELAITARGVREGIGEFGKRAGEGLPNGKRGPI